MKPFPSSFVLLLSIIAIAPPTAAQAPPLPSPLTLADAIRIAGERRDENQAAQARIRAGEAATAIVSALGDPMISPSLDHLPFMGGRADVSVTIEQQIPLSGIRRHRRASALADLDRLRAEANRTRLDVVLDAANAYLMLQERRRTSVLVDEQFALARDVVSAADARYASGTAPQSDASAQRWKSRVWTRLAARSWGRSAVPKRCSVRVSRSTPTHSYRRSRPSR